MRFLGATLPIIAVLSFATPVLAESVDDIVAALKPQPSALAHGNTRGIKPVATGEDAAPAGIVAYRHASYAHHAAAASAAPDAGALPSLSMTVNFVTGSASLTPSAMEKLRAVGEALKKPELQSGHFRIEGHTDTVGDAAGNKDLSSRRAAAVVTYLEQDCGVPGARLESVGLGEDDLAVPTPAQTPELRNRRVKIVNLNG